MEGYCQIQRRGPRAKTTEVEVRVALVCASIDDGRSLIGGTNLVSTVGRMLQVVMCPDYFCIVWAQDYASGSRQCINGAHKRQKFSSGFRCKAQCMHV